MPTASDCVGHGDAIRQAAMSKIQHLLSNGHIKQRVLSEMSDKTVSLAPKWLGLNMTIKQNDFFFHPQWERLVVPDVAWVHTSMWISQLLNSRNKNDKVT